MLIDHQIAEARLKGAIAEVSFDGGRGAEEAWRSFPPRPDKPHDGSDPRSIARHETEGMTDHR
jgi:hypothetical protein